MVKGTCKKCGYVPGCNAFYPDLPPEDHKFLTDRGYDITLVAGGHYQIASPRGPNGKHQEYNAAVVELHRRKCLRPTALERLL